MQLLYDGSDHCKHQFGIAISFLIPICEIRQTLHLLLLMAMPDSIYWYMCITIDLNAVHLFYM
jgi:hypothetical protein